MPNVKQIISNHNKTMLTKESSTENTTNNCNCRVKEQELPEANHRARRSAQGKT